jgi:hypothetical protein
LGHEVNLVAIADRSCPDRFVGSNPAGIDKETAVMNPQFPLTSPGSHRFERLAAEHRMATRGVTDLYATGDVSAGEATVVVFPGRTGVLGARGRPAPTVSERRSA